MAGVRPPDRWGVSLAGGDGLGLRSPTSLYAALRIRAVAPGSLVAFFPSDHYVSHDRALPHGDFSKSVLGAEPGPLAVLPVGGVRRSDLGHPDRVLAARLARSGAARQASDRAAGSAPMGAGAAIAMRASGSS